MPASDLKAPASVSIGGQPIELDDVERIEVRNFTGLPDMATIRIADPEGERTASPPYRIGDPVEVKLGGTESPSPTTIFKGEIVAAELEFSTSSALLSFRAYDQTHRLHRNRRSATFQDMTTSDIVAKVLRSAGVEAGEIENTRTVHAFMQQSMESDLDFIQRLASADNCDFGVADGSAFLRRRNGGASAVRFAWRENAVAFKPRMTAVQQHDSVTVSSYDPASKQAITATASEPTEVAAPAADARRLGRSFGAAELLVADRVVASQAEADALAQSTLDTLASGAFEADGVMHGDPAVKAGGKVKVEGFGAALDGEYVVTSTTHVYGGGDYRTKFAISGRHPRTLTDVMRPKQQRDWGTNGIVIGLVTNNDDPERQGRVRVKYPALGDQMEGTWARVAVLGAGAERGVLFTPDVGDEVAVAFEHGDTSHPIVLGGLYNGQDTPGPMLDGGSGSPRAKAFVLHAPEDAEVRTGKQLAVTSKEHLTMTVEGGDFALKTDDKIALTSGSTITLDGTGEVTIRSTAGINVEATGTLKLKGATVEVEGTAGVTVKGAIINIG